MRLFNWLHTMFHRRQVEQELDEELRFHLDRQVEANIKTGLTPEEARYAALRAMSGIEQRKEECRDMRRINLIEHFVQDIRHALRIMRRSPGFSLMAIGVMGLGIGASTAVFSLIDAVLLKPLPFKDPSRLVMVWEENKRQGYARGDAAPANYLDWKEQSSAFEDLAGYFGNAFNLTGEGEPERLDGIQTTPNLFSLLGVQPALGRVFSDSEGVPGQSQVAILSYGLWQRKFDGNRGIVGRSIRIDDKPYLVTGVMPEGFQFPRGDTQLWTPIQFPRTESGASGRNVHFLSVVGRLKPGVSWQQAENQVQTIAQRLAETYPATNKNFGALVFPLQQDFVRESRTSLWLLLTAALLVLIIACANVANMLMTRGIGRTREIAVRSALGASRMRVARQLFTEGLLLSLCGSAVGVVLAGSGLRFLERLVPPALSGAVSPSLDLRLLGFAVLTSLATGVVFGLAPLRETFRFDLSQAFRGRTSASARRGRSQAFLVSLETALAIVVVASTGLLVRTILNISAVDPGFRAEQVLSLRLELNGPRYATVESRVAFYREVVNRVRTLPGVSSAGFTTFLPYTNFGGTTGFFVEGRTELPPQVYRREISPDYLSAIRVPLLAGRWFSEQDDADHSPAIIISQGAAKLFNGDPIGKRVRLGNVGPWVTVVGVVGDIREEGLDLPSQRATAYTPVAQTQSVWFFNPRDLAIQVHGDPMNLAAAVRREIWSVDPSQTISQIRSLNELLERQVSSRKVQAVLLTTFSAAAIGLAALGIYALLSFVVQTRTQEFGIRVALGARTGDLVRSVLGQSLLWIGSGTMAGLALAVFITQGLSGLLYGVKPTDPPTLAGAVLLLFAVGLIAACIPAWRVARIDPMIALRRE